MESLLLPGVDRSHREHLANNPEAIFDILTMKSVKGTGATASYQARDDHDGLLRNEADFEAFALQFPIDDSISELFAFTSDSERKSTLPKFISGAKRPQVTRYSKLKKKLGWGPSEEGITVENGSTSSDSKRSKKAGGVQSKRHKWRTPKEKSVNFSDVSEFDSVGVFHGPGDLHRSTHSHTLSHQPQAGSFSESSGTSSVTVSDHVTYPDDVFESGSENDLIPRMPNQVLPPVPPKLPSSVVPDYVNVGSVRKRDQFSSILVQDPVALMKNLEEVLPEVAIESRDERGNTLLHRCVELGNPDGVFMILDRFPALGSDMNGGNMTPIELAVKTGQVGCLKVMLDRNRQNKALGTPLLNRLLNMSGSNGQSGCLKLLLSYMPGDQNDSTSLPGDARGNTAAHVAAKHGHLPCLQTLVTLGYDVAAENLIHQRPLQVAHQSSHDDCFQYLMALDVCEKLLMHTLLQSYDKSLMKKQALGIRSSIEQLTAYLQRYQKLFEETKQSLVENRESILETLVNIHEDLIQVTDNAGEDTADVQGEIRNKLDELAGEIERLEDTFEFSPLEDLDVILPRVLEALEDASAEISVPDTGGAINLSDDQLRASLSKLMKDVHEDAIAENWTSKKKIDDLVRDLVKPDVHINERKSNKSVQIQDMEELKLSSLDRNMSNRSTERALLTPQHGVRRRESRIKLNRTRSDLKVSDEGVVNARNEKAIDLTSTNMKPNGKPTWADLAQRPVKSSSETIEPESKLPQGNTDKAQTEIIKVDRKQSDRVVVVDMSHVEAASEDNIDDVKHQKDIRQLTLDERMDLLIAGERAKERLEDAEYANYGDVTLKNPNDTITKQNSDTGVGVISNTSSTRANSVCTSTTFTSITSDSSEFSPDTPVEYSKRKKKSGKFSFTSSSTGSATRSAPVAPVTLDSTDSVSSIDLLTLTSDSTSYWWDVEEENNENEHAPCDDSECSDDLQYLQDDSLTNEEMRRQRVLQHIRSLQRTRFPTDEFAEKITTATGETMGGFDSKLPKQSPRATEMKGKADNNRIVVDVNSALKAREGYRPIPKPRNRSKITKLKSDIIGDTHQIPADAVYQNHTTSRDQDLTSLDTHWEDMFMSDDDVTFDGKRWYEMSDDDVSLVPSWRSEDDTCTEGSLTPREV